MTMVDELAVDARVQHVGVSPAGRAAMARTELDEEKLGRLVRSFPPAERRAFWISSATVRSPCRKRSRLGRRRRRARRVKQTPPRSWWRGRAVGAARRSRSGGIVAGRGRSVMTAGRVPDDH